MAIIRTRTPLADPATRFAATGRDATRHATTRRPAPATLAGLCYLAVIAGGLFAEVAVRQALVVPGDAAATARAIAENELLWRLGIAVHLLYLVPALAVNALVSGLFRAVAPSVARLALVFGIAAVTVEAASLIFLHVPLVASESGAVAARQGGAELTYVATRLFSAGFGVSLVLFAGFCALVGALIVRTRIVPGWIGALMMLAGVCYVVNSLSLIISPAFASGLQPGILAPILLAELSFALWLLVKGVAVARA